MNKRINFLLLIIITFILTSCEEEKVQYEDGKILDKHLIHINLKGEMKLFLFYDLLY